MQYILLFSRAWSAICFRWFYNACEEGRPCNPVVKTWNAINRRKSFSSAASGIEWCILNLLYRLNFSLCPFAVSNRNFTYIDLSLQLFASPEYAHIMLKVRMSKKFVHYFHDFTCKKCPIHWHLARKFTQTDVFVVVVGNIVTHG